MVKKYLNVYKQHQKNGEKLTNENDKNIFYMKRYELRKW